MQVVTLISDFGESDYYAALLKGAILSHNSDIQIIDISHDIDTHDISQAAFYLSACCKKFPEGTIHIVAVNNYYDPDFEVVLFEYKNHFFIGPNNGVFSLAFDSVNEDAIYKILLDDGENSLFNLFAHGVSLISQNMAITEVGPPLNNYVKKLDIQPVVTNNEIRATIIHIDKFENVILNVHREFFEHIRKNRPFELFFKYYDPVREISNIYSDVAVGEVVCLFNSANYLEIAINMGKAASQLHLMKDETIQIKFLES
ncbi:MAG: SAM-dependent chlorinase/fluorinase [Saprospiraceae bacterium]|nr:SAM-dependent chlorinase/fluorinase [Bacteroidia bacterium]NNE13734.1 SAM-dependent chlorinase/fluorinase [Saprospiraceae bacterium]NNL91806.1 SAM-dependent chlorinase/fluorinase [Saprospiraceae bacterium]